MNYDPSQITVHARLLGHSVLRLSTGRLEPEMLYSSKLCIRPSGQLPAGRKPERVNEALTLLRDIMLFGLRVRINTVYIKFGGTVQYSTYI